ncbi:MAG: bifunctional 5,10-methylenetetrahydrofolate dehydrogenase/5,10-methenyltetrahydrofolate cyclohydrolase, partial [Candidatus Heimdallarchaeota archaeon]|nr:bifunctional 5,10-methylenetetrahydrofolate dehydrogenase/5,10-methenyltetrahydrofolate cyclohydrolase [Candidatus Heimdallarchaeota archaeon]
MCEDVMFLPDDSDTVVINGHKFADEYAERVLKPRCIGFKGKYGRLPKLATILVGENPASESYLRIKSRYFSTLCLDSEILRLPKDINERDLLNAINSLNNNSNVDGILVQLPLPGHIDADKVIESISVEKDVEGLSPGNVHAWAKAIPNLVPATALGVLALLKYYQISLEGKHAVIVGRSMIVGKPLLHLLLKENCTVTICHSRTKQLGSHTRQADILI